MIAAMDPAASSSVASAATFAGINAAKAAGSAICGGGTIAVAPGKLVANPNATAAQKAIQAAGIDAIATPEADIPTKAAEKAAFPAATPADDIGTPADSASAA
jgi:hypothetical protein